MANGTIAIVDDEKQLAQTMCEYLVGAGFDAIFFTDPLQFLEKLNTANFDLVFCDLKMPEKTGMELFDEIVSRNLKQQPRFILMSAFIQESELKDYYAQGIDEIILKPFELSDAVTVANFYLGGSHFEDAQSLSFIPLPITEFVNTSNNNYDIYVMIDSKYICVAKQGQPLTATRLTKLQEKGLRQIYLTQADFMKYSDLQLKLTEHSTLSRLDMQKRKAMVSHLIEVLSVSSFLPNQRTDFLQKAVTNFENVGITLCLNSKIFESLNKLKTTDKDGFARSSVQGTLSAAIAQTWRWTTSKVQIKLIMAGLLCDLGLRETPQLATKKRFEYDSTDLKDFESHPERSAKILESIPGIPPEVILVARQHHENDIGRGFPYRSKKELLHPYSRIIHAVSDFLDICVMNPTNSHEETMSRMFEQKSLYSEQVLKGLYLALGTPMPERISNVELPDKTIVLI